MSAVLIHVLVSCLRPNLIIKYNVIVWWNSANGKDNILIQMIYRQAKTFIIVSFNGILC